MKSAIHSLPRFLQLIGALLLVYVLFLLIRAKAFQVHEGVEFDREIKTGPTAAHIRTQRGYPTLDAVVGRIEIPRLKLSTMILEGVGEQELELGAGHVPGTALPGESANIVIAAHRDTFFRPLRKVARDDRIVLTTLGGSFQYVVDAVEVTNPEDTGVMQSAGDGTSELTLVTCYPFYFVGPAPDRFIVHARAVEPASVR